MLLKLKNIADIRTGVYLTSAAVPNANYLQVSDFDITGQPLREIRPTVVSLDKLNQHLLQGGDVLFAAKGTKNFSLLYRVGQIPSYAASSFLVIRVTYKEKILPEYVNWHLNLPSSISKLQLSAVGTSIPSISKQIIEDMEIEVPPLATQKAIVELAKLQTREHQLYTQIAERRKILIDNKRWQVNLNKRILTQ